MGKQVNPQINNPTDEPDVGGVNYGGGAVVMGASWAKESYLKNIKMV
jgi:hypothetical protein